VGVRPQSEPVERGAGGAAGDDRVSLAGGGVVAAAGEIELDREGGAYEAANGRFVDGPLYSFRAPVSALPAARGVRGAPSTVEVEATLDTAGYLRELVVDVGSGAAEATVDATYTQIGERQTIASPAPRYAHGAVYRVSSAAQLRSFLSRAWGCAGPSLGSTGDCPP
jgi:hypothetical protein